MHYWWCFVNLFQMHKGLQAKDSLSILFVGHILHCTQMTHVIMINGTWFRKALKCSLFEFSPEFGVKSVYKV